MALCSYRISTRNTPAFITLMPQWEGCGGGHSSSLLCERSLPLIHLLYAFAPLNHNDERREASQTRFISCFIIFIPASQHAGPVKQLPVTLCCLPPLPLPRQALPATSPREPTPTTPSTWPQDGTARRSSCSGRSAIASRALFFPLLPPPIPLMGPLNPGGTAGPPTGRQWTCGRWAASWEN